MFSKLILNILKNYKNHTVIIKRKMFYEYQLKIADLYIDNDKI